MKKCCLTGFFLMIFILSFVTGCQKEPTKEQVENSEYYKKLEKKYDKQTEKLNRTKRLYEEAMENNSMSDDVKKYLEWIEEGVFVQLEIEDTDKNFQNITKTAIINLAKSIVSNLDSSTKYTPDTLKSTYKLQYVYTLYEENNQIYEFEVYENNYVIMRDFPAKVYYCADLLKLGDAYMEKSVRTPKTSDLYNMADSSMIVFDDMLAATGKIIAETAGKINDIKMKKTKAAKEDAQSISEIRFYNHGKIYTVNLYAAKICISDSDQNKAWYQISKEDAKIMEDFLEKQKKE